MNFDSSYGYLPGGIYCLRLACTLPMAMSIRQTEHELKALSKGT